MFQNKLFLGAHLFGNISPFKKFQIASDLQLQAFQLFTASNLSYSLDYQLRETFIDDFFVAKKKFPYIKVFTHACYLLNIANKSNEENYKKSFKSLILELKRSQLLEIDGVVIHPGSFLDREKGLQNIAFTINEIYENYDIMIPLYIESSAGQGNILPTTIEEMKVLYDLLTFSVQKKIKFTIDTCHIFSSGYDLSSKEAVNLFFKQFDEFLGIDKIGLIHLNDSKYECGKKLDRHENIGKGKIGIEGMRAIVNHRDLLSIYKILETPVNTNSEFKNDIELLRSLFIS